MTNTCIFCSIPHDAVILKNKHAFAIPDKYPHSKGHMLIIPANHYESFFDLPVEVQYAVTDLLNETKKHCDEKYKPKGYNVIINNGRSAGQVVMHSHVHLIPRY